MSTHPLKIAIGSDHAGFALKSKLITWLEEKGHQVKDFGCFETPRRKKQTTENFIKDVSRKTRRIFCSNKRFK